VYKKDAATIASIITLVFIAVIFTPKTTLRKRSIRGTAVMLKTIESVIFSRKSISPRLKNASVRKYPGMNNTKIEPNTTFRMDNTVIFLGLNYYF